MKCLFIYMYVHVFYTNSYMLLTLQVSVFQHFNGIRAKDYWDGYREHRHSRAMMFVSLKG